MSLPSVGELPAAALARYRRLSEEMTLKQSVVNTTESAKFVASTAAVVLAVMSALGLASPQGLATPALAFWASLALALVLVALGLSMWFLLHRSANVNPENLDEVRQWYDTTMGRGWQITVAAISLMLALGVAFGVAVSARFDEVSRLPSTSLSVNSQAVVSASAVCTQCSPSTDFQVEIQVSSASGSAIVTRAHGSTDGAGALTMTIEDAVPRWASEVSLLLDGRVVSTVQR